MTIKVFIQARMGSIRFPGKSMYEFKGKPSLDHLINSVLNFANKSDIVVLTSDDKSDNIIENYCSSKDINILRGSMNNVSSRFLKALEKYPSDFFFRLNGDSPLFDYRILENLKSASTFAEFDIYTTSFKSKYPSGMNSELINGSFYCSNYNLFSSLNHFEHVTSYFYENYFNYKIYNLLFEFHNKSHYKFSFDDDFDRNIIENIFNKMEKEHYKYNLEEKLELYKLVTVSSS